MLNPGSLNPPGKAGVDPTSQGTLSAERVGDSWKESSLLVVGMRIPNTGKQKKVESEKERKREREKERKREREKERKREREKERKREREKERKREREKERKREREKERKRESEKERKREREKENHTRLWPKCVKPSTPETDLGSSINTVPFGVLIIRRPLMFRVPKKGHELHNTPSRVSRREPGRRKESIAAEIEGRNRLWHLNPQP